MRICDLAKVLFGKTGSAGQPLFLCIKGICLPLRCEFTYVIARDAEYELMLKRPAER